MDLSSLSVASHLSKTTTHSNFTVARCAEGGSDLNDSLTECGIGICVSVSHRSEIYLGGGGAVTVTCNNNINLFCWSLVSRPLTRWQVQPGPDRDNKSGRKLYTQPGNYQLFLCHFAGFICQYLQRCCP